MRPARAWFEIALCPPGVAVRIAIERFDPGVDREPYWEFYEVALHSRQTILEALLAIGDTLDPTLAFRRSCRSGICGACGALVNGRLQLMCQTLAGEITPVQRELIQDADVVLRPLPNFRVLKDLVVDMEPFLDALRRASVWTVPNPAYQGTIPREQFQRLWGTAACILCGLCATISVGDSTLTPASIIKVLRLAHDPRDARGLARLNILSRGTHVNRQFVEELKAICPKRVDAGSLLEVLADHTGLER